MKNLFLIFCFCCFGLLGFAQVPQMKLEVVATYPRDTVPINDEPGSKIFRSVPADPKPPGGIAGLYQRVLNAIDWDREVIAKQVVGDVVVSFLIDRLQAREVICEQDEVGFLWHCLVLRPAFCRLFC